MQAAKDRFDRWDSYGRRTHPFDPLRPHTTGSYRVNQIQNVCFAEADGVQAVAWSQSAPAGRNGFCADSVRRCHDATTNIPCTKRRIRNMAVAIRPACWTVGSTPNAAVTIPTPTTAVVSAPFL